MRRGEPRHGPARAPDGAFLCTAAIPLVLLLGGGPTTESGGAAEVETTWSANAAGVVQDQPPGEAVQEAGEAPPAQAEAPYDTRWAFDAQDAVLPSDAGPRVRTDGYFNLRSRSRWAEDDDYDDDDDHDLYAVLGADYVKEGDDGWGLHVMLHGSWGVNSQDEDSIFYGVQDTYSDRLDGRVYHAYGDAAFVDGLRVARLGRMVIYETPATAYFDGAQLETAPVGPTRFVLGAYGGNSVHQDEEWPSEEWMGGMYTHFRPWEDGEMRFDWMRLGDDDRYGDGDNDLISGRVKHRLTDELRVEGDYSLLDGDSNDMRLKGFWLWPEQDLMVRASYYELFEKQRDLSYELNPYFNFLNTYYPFNESEFSLSKSFGETLEIFGGTAFRRVDDDDDIGRYNREYDRYYMTAAFPELLPLDTTLSLTGEVWDAPDNDIETWGADLTSQVDEDLEVSIGSYYSLYKYYFDIDDERDDVRTYYGEVRKSVSESMSCMARYEYEDEEIDSYHSLRLGVTWRF